MIGKHEYIARRKSLAQKLPLGSIALISAASELVRNGDAHYRFCQDSDFYYLTGFEEPDALLVVCAGDGESILFNHPRDLAQEQWTGTRLGQEDAVHFLGVDTAYSLMQLDAKLPELLLGSQAIYYALSRYPAWDARFMQAWLTVKNRTKRGDVAPESLCNVSPIIAEMRVFKSELELQWMRKAADITIDAHRRVMRACTKLSYEYELEAELVYEFTRQGSRSVAYDSIVASGENACILHYTANNQALKPGQLVLIDAGAEFNHYAADVTRTFPANGRFSFEQRLIYELVLQAQKDGMAYVRPGCAWERAQQAIVHTLTTGLVDLGLLHGEVDGLIEQGAYRPFYMHQSGHWLGLDVHDAGLYRSNGASRLLELNMVLTVEPGLYISSQMPGVDSKWWGIGVRIEDDLLVTISGHDQLTKRLESSVADVEALMRDE